MTTPVTTKEPSWHATFPAPQATPPSITTEELHSLIVAVPSAASQFLVVDVRRTDFDVAFIRGAVNLPAQSFYQTLPSLLPLLSRYPQVIFHCQSSNGRGPRVAAYYQDALDAAGITDSKAVVLAGGIKGWVDKFGETEYTVKLAA